ncbi:cAMP-dependent protein kinase type II regulatory subunit [Halyomorpha halys]|uniref:cAMP-dependent protein kinase type II regulatory subunit n=1 Tax=Halyomorpha halys TaxID=286706 RepID=UPI0006D4FE95|nr:cAMP-dependent protein kinase type II regulatory subunit-like [Halyomorpha halys]
MATNAEVNVKISSEFRNILLELVVAYLIDQPSDFLEFAIEFLTEKRNERLGTTHHYIRPDLFETEEEVEDDYTDRRERRRSVFAEAYDPEADEDYKAPVYPKDKKEKAKMMDSLKNLLIFRSLDLWQKEQILDAMFKREVFPGEVLIKQGEEGDYFYIVASGVFEAWKDDQVLLNKYVNTGSFGELALLYNVPRAASVKAVTEGVVWVLDRLTFRKIVLTHAFKRRKMYEMLIDGVPLLSALNEYERLAVADALVTQTFQNGQKIIGQGEVADGMYFVESGKVRVTVKGKDGTDLEVKRLEAGEYFGELALLTCKPRAASVFAVGLTKVAFLDVDAFERLLGPCMDIMKRNFETYEAQLNQLFGKSIIAPNEVRRSRMPEK